MRACRRGGGLCLCALHAYALSSLLPLATRRAPDPEVTHDLVNEGAPIEAAAELGPRYEHDPQLLALPLGLQIPTLRRCAPPLRRHASFWIAALYTDAYADAAAALEASAARLSLCFAAARAPPLPARRLLALKPLFMLHTLRASPLPLVYMDADLQLAAFPRLFLPHAWPSPRDVLIFNWQANVSRGRRLKAASGVLFLNKSAPAEALLRAWAETMAHPNNSLSADDQALDLLVNDGGWRHRLAWGWLPQAYLRMPRFARVEAVINHPGWPGRRRTGAARPPVLPRERRA
ncbi:hypothetical protein AB1Y20_019668 [Prymnesium parvum]|uniref:Nucleotide-diphospho-sugar transferase domain-containing protein n=1 Tax=Prymnesium parvum TaxID=97485 RepID=A0AB34JV31_PRYPA